MQPLPYWMRPYAQSSTHSVTSTPYRNGQGRLLTSDVNDAAFRMAAETPVQRPFETRQPSITVPTWYPPAVAKDDGRLDPTGLGAQGWRNAPHQAMDFATGPTVETPTQAANAFDLWWRQPFVAENPFAGAAAQGNVTGTAELGPPVTSSAIGMPAVDVSSDTYAPGTPTPWIDPGTVILPNGENNPDGTPQPIVPRNSDFPWQNPDSFDVPSTGTTPEPSSPGGVAHYVGPQAIDLRNFGNFGNTLSAAEFLNTPLGLMNYGGGYPGANPFGGSVGSGRVTYAGATVDTPGSAGISPEEQHYYDTHPGEAPVTFDENARNNATSYPEPGIPRGAAVSPEVRRAQSLNTPTIGIGTVTEHNAQLGTEHNPLFGRGERTGQAYFNQGTGWAPIGSASTDVRWAPNSGTGNYQASQTAANTIASMDPGRPNRLDTPDSGVNRFGPGGWQTIDSEGGYSRQTPLVSATRGLPRSTPSRTRAG